MSFFSPLSHRVYKEIRSPNSQTFLRAESGIRSFGIHNSAQGIRNPLSNISIDMQSGIYYLEPGIHDVESRIQDCLGLPYMERILYQ